MMKKYIAAAAVSMAVLGALTGCGSGTDIGRDAALEAALNDAGVSESDTTRLKVSEDRDDGRKVYEIRFDVAEPSLGEVHLVAPVEGEGDALVVAVHLAQCVRVYRLGRDGLHEPGPAGCLGADIEEDGLCVDDHDTLLQLGLLAVDYLYIAALQAEEVVRAQLGGYVLHRDHVLHDVERIHEDEHEHEQRPVQNTVAYRNEDYDCKYGRDGQHDGSLHAPLLMKKTVMKICIFSLSSSILRTTVTQEER